MEEQISDIERRILAVLQQGLPTSATPYKDMAGQVGIETKKLLEILEDWKKCGKLRRIGAIVNHIKAGLGAGAMVVWQVGDERVCEVGQILAGFAETSHVYEREVSRNWPFNLYTMVHGKSRGEVKKIVERMSEKCGVSNYRLLFTEKELKKTPPIYVKTAES
jgi:DNA-binding Lrp family transcriptional regulator